MKTVVVNTSPLLVLDRIDCLHLLPRLFGHVIRPQSVVDEIKAGHNKYGISERIICSEWLETTDDPPGMALRPELGAGETAAITLALQRTGFRMSNSLIRTVKERVRNSGA
ncbi:MAG: hypothetical protein EOL88_12100 [Bacteroidia bacterium]|nr:hypothetical protein [Bacteroidia bacterium]